MKRIVLIFFLGIFSWANAQQESNFSHYMFNHQTLNPGYVGARGLTTFTSVIRSQWVGWEGAPESQTLTYNTFVPKKNLGLGMSIIHDKIGPTQATSAALDMAYHLRLNKQNHRLSLGLKISALNYFLNTDMLETVTPNDPTFTLNQDTALLPNVGFGAYYSTQKFYMGFAVPRLLAARDFGLVPHYYLMTGGLLTLSQEVLLKPSFLFKHTQNVSGYDLSLLAYVKGTFWFGGQFKNAFNPKQLSDFSFSGASLMLGTSIGEYFQLGYSYGFAATALNQVQNTATHELFFRISIAPKVEAFLRSPRFF